MSHLIYAIDQKKPQIHESAYIAPDVVIAGDVEIGANVTILEKCVLRGDENKIIIGEGVTLEESTVIHADNPAMGGVPTIIEDKAFIGANCMLHGAQVGPGSVIGPDTTILDGAKIGKGGVLATGSFLSPRKVVAENEYWAGSPAKKVRDLSTEEDRSALASR